MIFLAVYIYVLIGIGFAIGLYDMGIIKRSIANVEGKEPNKTKVFVGTIVCIIAWPMIVGESLARKIGEE